MVALNYHLYSAVETILCDQCGCCGDHCDFFDLQSEEGRETLQKFGWDLSKPEHLEHVHTFYSVAICPECGNFSNFELYCNPFDVSLEKIVREDDGICKSLARN